MKWFRCYTDILSDDRLGLIAFEDRWHYIAILAMKAKGLIDEAPGELRDRRIYRNLGLTAGEADNVRKRLLEVGLINGEWQPVAWEKRQYKHDDSSERVRRFREKQKEKQDVTACNGYVTVAVTGTDTDTESEVNTSSGRRGRRFTPPTLPELSEFISTENLTVDPVAFFNHYESKGWLVGKTRMKDWRAAARGWSTREKSNAANRPRGNSSQDRSVAGRIRANVARELAASAPTDRPALATDGFDVRAQVVERVRGGRGP